MSASLPLDPGEIQSWLARYNAFLSERSAVLIADFKRGFESEVAEINKLGASR